MSAEEAALWLSRIGPNAILTLFTRAKRHLTNLVFQLFLYLLPPLLIFQPRGEEEADFQEAIFQLFSESAGQFRMESVCNIESPTLVGGILQNNLSPNPFWFWKMLLYSSHDQQQIRAIML